MKEDLTGNTMFTIRRFNIVKMSIILLILNKLNEIPIKILKGLLADIDKLILKFTWKCKSTRLTKEILKCKVERLTGSDSSTYYKQ